VVQATPNAAHGESSSHVIENSVRARLSMVIDSLVWWLL
jgi:hypothetical protein